MAIVNGKRLYNSEKLDAVAREDDRAAAEYAWLMAGISDDFGRFRLSPRRILGRAYERRPVVNELMIGDWLALYEKHKLLRLYASGGTQYGEWTNYMGDPPSQRRYHSCPEPDWSAHKHNKECKFRDDAETTRRGRPRGTPLPTQLPTPLPTPPLPAVPSVTTVTTERKTTASAPPRRATWLTPFADAWKERFGAESKPPFGELASAFEDPPIPPAELLSRFRRFLAASTGSQFARPVRFMQGLGEWATPSRASPSLKPSVGERNIAAMERFVVRGGEIDRPESIREGPRKIGDGEPPAS